MGKRKESARQKGSSRISLACDFRESWSGLRCCLLALKFLTPRIDATRAEAFSIEASGRLPSRRWLGRDRFLDRECFCPGSVDPDIQIQRQCSRVEGRTKIRGSRRQSKMQRTFLTSALLAFTHASALDRIFLPAAELGSPTSRFASRTTGGCRNESSSFFSVLLSFPGTSPR